MKKLVLVALLCASFGVASPVWSGPLEDLVLSCSKEQDAEKRLACYDEMASAIKEAEEKKGGEWSKVGNWAVSRGTSKMDDSKRFSALLLPPDGELNKDPVLSLSCLENSTRAIIFWESFLGSKDTVKVQYRIDKKPAKIESWPMATDNKSTFAPRDIAFAKSLRGAKTLVARVPTYSQGTRTVEFDLTGVDAVVDELAATCNWK